MPPLFFIGSSSSMAARIISQDHPAAGVMVSVTQLSRRRSDFVVDDWIMDSGAFTEVARHSGYGRPVEWYFQKVLRWAKCGNLLAAVSQDWMCEGFVLKRTGLSIKEHQRLTIERYDALVHLAAGSLSPPIMPVLQGYSVSDYLVHVDQYSARLAPGSWVGIGSVCRRNGAPEQVRDILRAVKNKRSDLRLHGFGLKHTSLESPEVRELLYSCTPLSMNRQFVEDFISADAPCFAMGVVEEAERPLGCMALRTLEAIPAKVSSGGFNFGHSILGNSQFEVLHFIFEFYGFKKFNVLVNPNNPLVQSVLSMMIESGEYFFFALSPNNSATAFKSEIGQETLCGIEAYLPRIKASKTSDSQYDRAISDFLKNPEPPGTMLDWVCRDNMEYLDLSRDTVTLNPSKR